MAVTALSCEMTTRTITVPSVTKVSLHLVERETPLEKLVSELLCRMNKAGVSHERLEEWREIADLSDENQKALCLDLTLLIQEILIPRLEELKPEDEAFSKLLEIRDEIEEIAPLDKGEDIYEQILAERTVEQLLISEVQKANSEIEKAQKTYKERQREYLTWVQKREEVVDEATRDWKILSEEVNHCVMAFNKLQECMEKQRSESLKTESHIRDSVERSTALFRSK